MTRRVALLVALPALIISLGLVLNAGQRTTDGGPIYTPLDVQFGMLFHPGAWANRAIQVRGRTESLLLSMGRAPPCFWLIDATMDSSSRARSPG
jgi:hypothetical protein